MSTGFRRVTLLSSVEVLLEGPKLFGCQEVVAACKRLGMRFQRIVVSAGARGDDLVTQAPPIDLWLLVHEHQPVQRVRQIRAAGFQALIYVVGSADDGSEVEAAVLDAGADGYSAAHIQQAVLAARLRATLRRESGTYPAVRPMQVGLRRTERLLVVGANEYVLTPRELELVDFLQSRRGQWVRRDQLLQEVFGAQSSYDPSVARTHILNIRKKLNADSWLLRTDRLAGVMLVAGIDNQD